MKKLFTFVATILLGASAFGAIPFESGSPGHTFTLSPGTNNLGVTISNAVAGDTVVVKAGVYTVSNNILVTPGVIIRGEGSPLVKNFVDGSSGASCFNLSDNVIIDGLEITNCIADTKFQVCVGTHDTIASRNATNWVVKNCIFHGDTDCVVIKTDSAKVIAGEFRDCVGYSKWDCYLLYPNNPSANITVSFWNCVGVIYTESVKQPGMSGYTHAIGIDGLGKGYLEVHGGYFASTNNSVGWALTYKFPGVFKTYMYGATLIGTNSVFIEDCPSGSAGWRSRLYGCSLTGPVHDLSTVVAADGPADFQIISGGPDTYYFRDTLIQANGTTTTIMGDAITSAGGDTPSALAPTATEGAMRRQLSDTTATSDTGVSGNLLYRTGKFINFKASIKQDNIATKRFFYGLTDQTITVMGGLDNPAGNYAGFLLTTNITGNRIIAITKDNVTQTATTNVVAVQDTGVTHLYEVIFDDDYPRVIFKYDGYVIATHTTHLPAAGTNMRYVIGGKKWDSAARNTDIEYIDIRSTR